MKILQKIGSLIFYLIVLFIVVSAVGTAALKRPILMSSVRSNSMYPLFQKGDMLLVSPILKNSHINLNDIVVFKTEGGSYDSKGLIVHRIISGSNEQGFTTKGDANDYTDQAADNPSIKPEWISARVLTIGPHVLKISLLGYLPLLMEQYSKSPLAIPAIILFIGIIIAGSEFFSHEGKKTHKQDFDKQLIYFISGLTVSILFFGTMLSSSQSLKVTYGVSESNKSALIGSDIGILKLGETSTKPLTELTNKGFIPTTAILTTDDKQITLSHSSVPLKKGTDIKTEMTVTGLNPGQYNSVIHIGILIPLLPQNILYNLLTFGSH